MKNTQLIESIRAARMSEREKQVALSALETAEHLVDAFEVVKNAVRGLFSNFGAKPSFYKH